ncbi:MAG: hypothetical protein U1A27_04515 [Phycisphaerae bacterium]
MSLTRVRGPVICLAPLIVAITFLVHESGPTYARDGGPETTFFDIIAGSPFEYATYQVKFTYTGPQEKSVFTVMLSGNGRVPDITEFAAFRTPGVHYANDDINTRVLVVNGNTIQRFIEDMIPRPPLQTPGVVAGAKMSLMIERGFAPGQIVFEHLASEYDAIQVVNLLDGAVRLEPLATIELVRRFRNITVGP